ncbi:hypothetical protein CYMTET_51213 [Cymbomonas tetramitiformis]|uniref:Band 7 domain-containing protein n=1 Tax=Cymbomonas tetramitiformis TaxID=36881 RepID=A0AAE0ETZ0_9CHLO|nr:hypothetical protein CYMTET_51213 [Cymbomonas tetramitiformis]
MRQGTKLVSVQIPSMDKAHELIGRIDQSGGIPLILLPARSSFAFYMSVPEGFYALNYESGKLKGVIKPGFHILSPLNKVQYLVSKQWTVFDSPVDTCTTKDHVSVDIDCIVVFRIRADGAETFVTKSSPSSLQMLMSDKIKESVRILARKKELVDIYSLSGNNEHVTGEMLLDLQNTFHEYGIEVKSVTITQVAIPVEHSKRLEDISWFTTREEDQKVSTEFQILESELKKEIAEKRESLRNERLYQENRLNVARTNKEKDVARIQQETKSELAQTEARTTSQVMNIKEQQDKVTSEFQYNRERKVAEIQSDMKAALEELYIGSSKFVKETAQETDVAVRKMRAEVDQTTTQQKAEMASATRERLAAAKFKEEELKAKALTLEAEVEKKISNMMTSKREYDLMIKQLQVMKSVVNNQQFLVMGESGTASKDHNIPYHGPSIVYETNILQEKVDHLQGILQTLAHAKHTL